MVMESVSNPTNFDCCTSLSAADARNVSVDIHFARHGWKTTRDHNSAIDFARRNAKRPANLISISNKPMPHMPFISHDVSCEGLYIHCSNLSQLHACRCIATRHDADYMGPTACLNQNLYGNGSTFERDLC